MDRDPFYGAIAEQFSETDYQFGAQIKVPKAKHRFHDKQIQYNQNEVDFYSCTIHGAMGAYSDLTGYEFSLEERKDLWQRALSLGAIPKLGWYINSAVNLVRNYVKGKEKVVNFRLDMGGSELFDILKLGYSIVCGFSGNRNYSLDKEADGILDGLSFGPSAYGHALRMTFNPEEEIYEIIVDNYPGQRKYNIYKIKKVNLKRLVRNGIFFKSGYFYALDPIEFPEDKVPIWALSSWKKAVEKGEVESTDDPMMEIMGERGEGSLIKTGIFSKKEGNVSLARWVVALDRLNLLD